MRLKILSAFASALFLSACGGGGVEPLARYHPSSSASYSPAWSVKPSEATTAARNFEVHGIDVSKYQGDIDWQAAHDGGVQFAWIKATEGGDKADEKFRQNWEQAKAAGIPRGAYHFVYWCRTPQEQIRFFQQNVPVDPDALPPVLDVELTPGSKSCPRTLYKDEIIGEMRTMLEAMERHFGKKPIIYSTVDFYEGILHPGALTEYPIWVRSTKYHPSVRYGSRRWHFWQYQSDAAIPGIRGKVDRNTFFGTQEQWSAYVNQK